MGLIQPPAAFTQQESNWSGQPATTWGISVAGDAVAHTKNATYTELFASTAFDCYQLVIRMSTAFQAATDTGMLVDIAIGAAASETVIIANLNAGHATESSGSERRLAGQEYMFPLYIPAGSRISATAQGVQTSDTVLIAMTLFGGPTRPVWAGQTVTTYGADTATSQGVEATNGTTSEGSWAEITASTTAPHRYLAAGIGGADNNLNSAFQDFDFGLGAGGTEVVLSSDWRVVSSVSEAVSMASAITMWADVPTGTRLVTRSQGSTTGNFDVIMYGVS